LFGSRGRSFGNITLFFVSPLHPTPAPEAPPTTPSPSVQIQVPLPPPPHPLQAEPLKQLPFHLSKSPTPLQVLVPRTSPPSHHKHVPRAHTTPSLHLSFGFSGEVLPSGSVPCFFGTGNLPFESKSSSPPGFLFAKWGCFCFLFYFYPNLIMKIPPFGVNLL